MDAYNTTYYWKVVVNDSFTETTALYHFTTLSEGSGYNIIIEYEETGNPITMDANTTYNLTVYFDDNVQYTQIATNPFSVNYSKTPLLMRLYVTKGNLTYYRSLIPDNASGQIIFYIPQNTTYLYQYTFQLDDKTGVYTTNTSYFRIYENQKWNGNGDK